MFFLIRWLKSVHLKFCCFHLWGALRSKAKVQLQALYNHWCLVWWAPSQFARPGFLGSWSLWSLGGPLKTPEDISWLVDSNIFPYIRRSIPNWLIFFRVVQTTNQFLYWKILQDIARYCKRRYCSWQSCMQCSARHASRRPSVQGSRFGMVWSILDPCQADVPGCCQMLIPVIRQYEDFDSRAGANCLMQADSAYAADMLLLCQCWCQLLLPFFAWNDKSIVK